MRGEPRRDPGVARHVAALLAGLADAAGDDIIDQRRVDVVALEQRSQREPEEIGRMPTCKRTLALADRRPERVDDHCLANLHDRQGTLPRPCALLLWSSRSLPSKRWSWGTTGAFAATGSNSR